jgi:Zn-dependent peptidase ImmA (M78 family)
MNLATALGVRPSFLLSEPEVSVDWVAYRKFSSLSARDQEVITAVAIKRLEGELPLRRLFNVGLNHSLPRGVAVRDADSAEVAADRVRNEWRLGESPINGVIETIEDHGGIVLSWPAASEFDGLSGWTNEGAPVMVLNTETQVDRSRFSAAHELGHLVMSFEVSQDDYEKLAHRFAAAFLVPRSAAFRELGNRRRTLSFPELGLLKQRWGLSMQAWVHRAYDLGIIDTSHYGDLMAGFRRRKWHRIEPVRYEGKEEPMLLRRLVSRAVIEGIISSRDAADICPNYESGYETGRESELSLRELARLPRDERHRILASAQMEVDVPEVEAWDSATCDHVDSELAEA